MSDVKLENRDVTLAAWRTRLQHVTDWLVDHLDQPFDLYHLAEVAHFSPYHFHRVYTAAMGEPVAETVRRMRLHRAAVDLATHDKPVIDIARRANYSSVQAFGRAFRLAYGVPPGEYRQHAKTSSRLTKEYAASKGTEKSGFFPAGLGDSPQTAVHIVWLDPVRVVALAHGGSYHDIGKSFQKLTAWAIGRHLFGADTRMYGIYYDDPDYKPVTDLKSKACISVRDDFEMISKDDPVHICHTSGGRCARMVFTGPYAELPTAYSWLYHVWLPASGEEPGDPPIEEYLNDPRSCPPAQWQTAISIPLKNLS
jgi:AraC family transcriptional regulator